jgi:exodeoxyribonuclease V alpha subunit
MAVPSPPSPCGVFDSRPDGWLNTTSPGPGRGDVRRKPPYHKRSGDGVTGDLFHTAARCNEEPTTLEGVVETLTYVSEETGWSVVRLLLPSQGSPVAVVGHLPGVQAGENLRIHGRWTQDKRYGRQFQVESFVTVQPSTLVGMEKYLGSGLIPGIGKVTAERMVRHFGLDTLDVIDRHPERLEEVEGIGRKKRLVIAATWDEQRAVREVMLFLQSHGVSTTFAYKIFRRYGARAISLVKDDPYRLAVEISGIGFKSADRIAAALGIPRDSPRRARAGVLHTLGGFSDGGHLFAPRRQLVEKAAELLQVGAEFTDRAVDDLSAAGLTVIEPGIDEEPVYQDHLYGAEKRAAERLREILEAEPVPVRVEAEHALEWFEKREGIFFAEPQREAVRRAVRGKVLVVTGGPGTGKTTIIRAIVTILEQEDEKIRLCAPTGRAAKRLAEAAGREATTIHRLLEFNPGRQSFERNGGRPLEADLLVVDEMSMVDAILFDSLLDALPASCRVILVGDVDQLPSVGPGNVLGDLIRSGVVEVVELKEIFRQARESLIVINAHRINRGEMPDTSGAEEGADFFFVEKEEPAAIVETMKELIARRIPSRFGVDPVNDIQILTPMHRGELGAINLNAVMQDLLNPGGKAVAKGSRLFRVGDKVMQIRNNYDLGVFNGDLGRIESADLDARQVTVSFDRRAITYDYANLDQLILGYACSIHKAQGSEYPVVVMPVHTQHYALLQRNLLYTGITRGKRLVVTVGTKKALGIAVRNNRVKARHTRLAERLRGDDTIYVDTEAVPLA